ncbi:MAG TPA: aminotransferase class V-fold PLP-dependent enzyme [Clostridia bacterium]|nr:aminotransferase class V-fold PLP-dependent enzyme [Clostridia bacterium]
MSDNMDIRDKMRSQLAGKAVFEQACTYAYDYMDRVSDRPVVPSEKALRDLDIFDEPLPQQPGDAAEILSMLHEYGSPATMAQTAGRYFGFVNGSSTPAALAAKWLSDVWDQNTALYVMSPIAAQLEAVCEKWIVSLLGLPEETAAGFVSGTSIATACGLAAGRNELLKRQGWDAASKGLFGAPPLRVVVGEQAHATVFKALALLGLGRDRVEKVPVDSQGCMRADRLPELDNNTLLVLQAGNVNSGAFDPLDELCERARKADSWVHIDGAFGLLAAASGNKRHLTKGMEKADSWSVDAHKTLNAPYDCGIILCRNRDALIGSFQTSGSYILYSGKRDGMLYAPEMSRRARGVELWATLKFFGRKGVEELIDGLCDRAVQFAELLAAKGFRILNDVVFNQVLVACASPEETKAALEKLQKSGECWCGGAVWKGEPAIRISVCSWATTPQDVERSAAAFAAARSASRSEIERRQ